MEKASTRRSGIGFWDRIITDAGLRKPFLRFVVDRRGDTARPARPRRHPGVPQVTADVRWCLELDGCRGESVFILLRSETRLFQLAPVDVPGFVNAFDERRLRYPASGWLEFEPADGLGWRELIAIRSDFIAMPRRDRTTGYECGAADLDLFARHLRSRLRGDRVAVDSHAFMLTPAPS